MHVRRRRFAQVLLERPGTSHDHVDARRARVWAAGAPGRARRARARDHGGCAHQLLGALLGNEPAGRCRQQSISADTELCAEVPLVRRARIRIGVDGVGQLPARLQPEMPEPPARLFRHGIADGAVAFRADGHQMLDCLDGLAHRGTSHGKMRRAVLDEHGRDPAAPREGEPCKG